MPQQQQQPAGEKKKRGIAKGRHLSAMKRERQSERRALRNQRTRSRLKTLMKKVHLAVKKKDSNLAQEALRQTMSELAKAATRGVVHSRYASRHVSRLSSLVHTL